MTKSTSSDVLYLGCSERHDSASCPRRVADRLPAGIVLVVVAERRLEHVLAIAADHFPANAVADCRAIGIRIDQKPQMVCTRTVSKKACAAPRANGTVDLAAGGLFVEGLQNLVLLLRSGGRKFLDGRETFRELCACRLRQPSR